MLIGYARASSHGQSLDRQIGALSTMSVDKIFREKVSGKTVKARPRLDYGLLHGLNVKRFMFANSWQSVCMHRKTPLVSACLDSFHLN
ncbi:hypothetical protein D1821_19030 (plasmid) [Phaeobacter inhibens]|uniref:recombinase family protein n=1 Tax=Phaeobacter TaxID=302485 RepID=UPI0009D9C048|nr:recombinase family protein [Phaeobacter inhibens]AXT44579.1 hypothetical protein D1821_19030 [Phaeobacter inhibens]